MPVESQPLPIPNETSSLWQEGAANGFDPLGDRGVPDGWQPSADRLRERLRRIEKRAEGFTGNIGAGALSKRIR